MQAKPVIAIYTGAVEITGAVYAAYRQASALKDIAHTVLIVSDRATIRPADFPDVEVVRLPSARVVRTAATMAAYPFQLIKAARALARFLRERECKRLQINDFYLLEGQLSRLFGFRGQTVTWVRIDPRRYGGPLATVWLRAARQVSSAIVAVSRFIQCQLGDECEATLLYDPCPDLPLSSAPDGQRLVFIGNYSEGKGQDIALKAFSRLFEDYPSARLAFHGGDLAVERNRRFRESLLALREELDVAEQVSVEGFLSDPGTALDGALLALNLSWSESFSLTCQEASARGIAVLATRCGGPEEIVEDGKTGWLVPVGDIEAAEAAIREALADPERTHRLGREGARLMRERFGTERFRSKIMQIYGLPAQDGLEHSGEPA